MPGYLGFGAAVAERDDADQHVGGLLALISRASGPPESPWQVSTVPPASLRPAQIITLAA